MRISTTLLPVVCLLVVLTVCSLETVTVPVSAQTRDAKSAKKARQKTRNAGPKGTGTYEEYPVPRDEVICFSLYTVSGGTLKLTAQLYPLKPDEDRTVRLEIKDGNAWKEVARTKVIEYGWTAPFRVENWDDSQRMPYRVAHGKTAFYEGTVRGNPVDKEEIVVAGFTGNSVNVRHGGDISREDLVANIKKIDADVLFFSGDQVYDHRQHYKMWLKFGRDFGEIIKDRPTISIPDDHDVGQPNIWGASGRKSTLGGASDGGYAMPVDYVKSVERAQTSHLPDPFDPTPIQRGIGVYYTYFNWGRISFAVLEDRKFKSGPAGIIPKQGPRPDHITNPNYDPSSVDVPEAVLLGKRQLKFLDTWGQDWKGADMKVALSQTIFCGGAHIHGKVGGRLHADLDSNGWPQTGRNKAIDALRKCFAIHYAGDQHLATIFHHGVDEFRDGCFSFCVPSIANLYLRWWRPLSPGENRKPGASPYTGDHLDGFHNKVTCFAVANPDDAPASGDKLTTRAAGFGVMRLNKRTRKIVLECYPRNVDVGAPATKQYPGWPLTIDQLDNYGRKAKAYLPTLVVRGQQSPVVKVIDESDGSWVYALRIRGTEFRPKVFKDGNYTIEVGEGDRKQILRGVKSIGANQTAKLEVAF
ncbi:MAG TPA: hypothetical protein QF564_10575 [Pirellulaceae bacterium]|nr:hypothetical protein [Pirellulaceae bacterium]